MRSRTFWRLTGWALFAIGLLGLVLPVLPTTGFWILAVIALQRSDPALARRIRDWPGVGRSVSDFLDHGAISGKGKLAALMAMAASASLLVWLTPHGLTLWIALGGIAAGALYVATRPRPPRERGEAGGGDGASSDGATPKEEAAEQAEPDPKA